MAKRSISITCSSFIKKKNEQSTDFLLSLFLFLPLFFTFNVTHTNTLPLSLSFPFLIHSSSFFFCSSRFFYPPPSLSPLLSLPHTLSLFPLRKMPPRYKDNLEKAAQVTHRFPPLWSESVTWEEEEGGGSHALTTRSATHSTTHLPNEPFFSFWC